MQKHNLLKNAIETLKLFQSEMHDTLDSSKQAELNNIIQDLEQYQQIKNSELLQVLGHIISWLPEIKELMEWLMNN